MERDSRRDRGQWRGCHTFKDIICEGDDPSRRVPRSGGLKMGNTYYYYYELDGSTETDDPTMPSTTACPYLPGQRVNKLWVPLEQSGRERCASAGSVHSSDYQTLNPDDRFTTPQQRPVTPVVRLTAAEPETAILPPPPRASSPSPKLLPPCSAPNSTSAAAASTWSPRRLFRRPSPARNVTGGDSSHDGALSTTSRAPRLISWASSSSLSSLRRSAAPPSVHSVRSTSSSQGGSRSRDISPESLRRFLVEDAPPKDGITNSTAASATAADADDEANDDEHNFATSAVSETAPFTILSPPPPPRPSTPVPFSLIGDRSISNETATLPMVPTRAAPSIPPTADRDACLQLGSSWLSLSPAMQATSPPLPALSFRSHGPHGSVSSASCSISQSETEDDEDVDIDHEAFLLPPRHVYGQHSSRLLATASSSGSSKAAQEHHSHIVVADSSFPDTNSTSTLVPGGRLFDLTEELGWMASAIQG
ncbi:hypothetical protein CMQ_2726 [Grosmannia clavigera kw1407]|uniref:Uncharacterized protein n=1 Tax=Grosmannia clavigera (strain kw1407 / UAMH 11150) TaxID=655863 RepID=F0XGZ3_GROCL|nr:uncharacterized protein CMQ_2726 [Grosmannia clavigera kw1407]EFX02797.1 hypothetical protein CMQ_2726 [Grosmannia clavigera kw1407]